MKCRLQLLARLTAAALLWGGIPGNAEPWRSQQYNCAITLPIENGWSRVSVPMDMIKISVRSDDHKRFVSVFVTSADQGVPEPEFIERFKKKRFEESAGNSGSEQQVQVDGHTAYLLTDVVDRNGTEIHRADTIFLNDGKFYQIDALAMGSDPLSDPAIRECVCSFRFVTQIASTFHKTSFFDPAGQLPQHIVDITVVVLGATAIALIAIKKARKQIA